MKMCVRRVARISWFVPEARSEYIKLRGFGFTNKKESKQRNHKSGYI